MIRAYRVQVLAVCTVAIAFFNSFALEAVAQRRTRDAAIQRAITKIVGAAIANAVVNQKKDGGLAESIARAAAQKLREVAIDSALEDIYPMMSMRERRTTRIVICLVLDGELSIRNLAAETAKEEILAELKRRDPDLAKEVEIADFIFDIFQKYVE